MKKKVYAVRKGRNPGIYEVWAETERQVLGFSGAEYHSFTYMAEYENEDETVEMSRAYALKQANEYLGNTPDIPAEVEEDPEGCGEGDGKCSKCDDEAPEGFPAEYDEEEGNVPVEYDATAEEIPVEYDVEPEDFSIEYDTEEGEIPVEYDEEEGLVETVRPKSDQEILEIADLRSDSFGNSPWVALLLTECDRKETLFIDVTPASKYSCTALYTALLFLVLDDDRLLERRQQRYLRMTGELPFAGTRIQEIWHKTEDYIQLRIHFEDNDMTADDLQEVFRRYQVRAKKMEDYTNPNPESCTAMRKFIRQGGHTILELYKELVENPVYRAELVEISGSFLNPDFEAELTESKVSMQDIVARTAAIDIALRSEVVGQNDVIDQFKNAYFSAEKTINAGAKKKGPRHAYLFAGPSGVGKTFIAEIAANTLGIPYKRFDMSGYTDRGSVTEFLGSSTLWKDSKAGVLTDFVMKNPRCVLLFDEIEKACKEIILVFLQILDEGKCFDKHYDKDIDFKNTIVILTTNAGKQLYQNAENENLTLLPASVITDALRKDKDPKSGEPYFPPEIISRMSSHTIIMFNHLRADSILKIIKTNLKKQLQMLNKEYQYDTEDRDSMLAATALYTMGSSMDARNGTVLAKKILDGTLSSLLFRADEKPGFDWHSSLKKIIWEHDFTDAADEIKQFYLGEKNGLIAIFGQAEEIHDRRFVENHIQIKATTDPEAFMQIFRKENVLFAAVDYEYGLKDNQNSLSITDIRTEGSKVFSDIRKDYKDVPVYILHSDKGYSYSRTEKDELCRRGALDFIKRETMQTDLPQAYRDVCCQRTMETLSLRRQRLAYHLKIELDEKHRSGRIILHDFKLEQAVEAEDKDLLLSADMKPDTHWDDICVSEKLKDELKYFIDFMKNPGEYIRAGLRPPKGVLLYGPAGTGKTSLARVVAAESGVNFLEISGDQLTQGADIVHRVFSTARKYAPAVLFIDEVDEIGKDRSMTFDNTAMEALLTEMDGFKKIENKPILIMAATNLKKKLDGAFVRRFDRDFELNVPDDQGRKWMLERLIGKQKNQFSVSERMIDSFVQRSGGLSFAQIENIVETAKREAFRSGKPVDDILLDEALESIHGEIREGRSSEAMRRTAYHEAGHALIRLFHNGHPTYMSIVARGQYGGYVRTEGIGEEVTKESLLEEICCCLGGRAAEIACGFGLTPGASVDLQQATKYATCMVCSWGMYEKEVGLAVISKEQLLHNEKAQELINQILSEQLQEAIKIINDNKAALERLVEAVTTSEKKSLTGREIEAAYQGGNPE